MNKKPIVLTIGGMDPSAGAGILADVKSIEAAGAYGMAILSANTFQNDIEYDGTDWVSSKTIIRQIEVLQRRHQFSAIKIGLIESFETVQSICQHFGSTIPIVWDPILKASAGYSFHSDIDKQELLQLLEEIHLLTPNFPEAEILFGTTDVEKLMEIQSTSKTSILLKGGHSQDRADDVLITDEYVAVISGERFDGYAKHGTGCILSAAIASHLALGDSLEDSCRKAKHYVEQIMKSNTSALAYHIY